MNKLDRIADFQQVLANYSPSVTAKQLLQRTKLVLLVGPSSSGRNTIINKLLQSDKYHYIVSDTTRKPRVNNGVLEQDGREYWFRSETDMLNDLQAGEFLEAAVIHGQQVSGISVRELASAADRDLIAINEIEVIGANNIHTVKPDTVFLFILPPNFDEWMARMASRGELPRDEVRRRLQSAVSEISVALERDYYSFVVNDTFARTAARIEAMISTAGHDDAVQTENRLVAEQLVKDTRAYLDAS